MRPLLGLILIFLLASHLLPAQEMLHTFYLLGDAGEPEHPVDLNLNALRQKLNQANEQSTLILLGDNIYPKGLPPEAHPDRAFMEQKLLQQLAITDDFKGNTIVIPGNHDWEKGKKDGWKQILNQQAFVDAYLGNENSFLPRDGCPGPVEIAVNEEITLIIIDTQWLLHPWEKPGPEEGCEVESTVDVLNALQDIMLANKHKKVLVAAHHPMYSEGIHGGHIPFKKHLFPLTEINPSLYIPLPVIGSIYPFYRSVIGNIQDIPHPKYKAIRNAMVDVFSQYPSTVFANGHEHSLQLIEKNQVSYITSGSGAKTTHVKTSGEATYAASKNGFSVLKYFKNGDIKVEYWVTDDAFPDGKLDFEKTIGHKPYQKPQTVSEFLKANKLSDSTVVVNASDQYIAGKMRQKLMGKNYRDVWAAEVEVPVFDIGTEQGGLTIVKKGGGMQTKSLRLEAKDGQQYVLRSIEKYPENAVPEALRKTFAVDIVQDQISASHPYAAFVIPALADAAGVYHTNPQVVFIPDDPRFGEYRETFANSLALYEERPDDDGSDQPFFGNSEDIESTSKVLEELREDNDHEVDQPMVLRSRLFDMIIGDWDRHDDQWRWASFDKEHEKGDVFQPIPRDRDQAFFVNEGFFPKIASKKWALPKLEGFDHTMDWPPGFMFNARYFDRTFLTKLDRDDWITIANELQQKLTDEVIEKAISRWPPKIYALTGEEVIAKLKSRRDNLVENALAHYRFLAREVEILGSDKHEHFLIDKENAKTTSITVWKIDKDFEKQKVIYQRTFNADDTREIRLYGFDDEDVFEQQGLAKNKIKVRIIGGADNDLIKDQSISKGAGTRTIIYDTKNNTRLSPAGNLRKKLKNDESVNAYDRKSFLYNVLMPLLYGQINADDGLFLGGGFLYTKHGWRKTPFAAQHKLMGNFAFATKAFNLEYTGEFSQFAGQWNLVTEAIINQPFSVSNFFGLGNESRYDFENFDIDYYRVRYESAWLKLWLKRQIGDKTSFSFGSVTQRFQLEEEDEQGDFGPRYIYSDQQNQLPNESLINQYYYTGASGKISLDDTDHLQNPSRGIRLNAGWETYWGLNENSRSFSRFAADFSFYYSFSFPGRVTIANRTGYANNTGDFEFFNYNQLGGKTNLRGYRRNRFYGETAFYNNTDIRFKIASFRSYLFPGSLGLLAFHDLGRVWIDGENSDRWYNSTGGGIWISPLGQAVLSLSIAFTEEENLAVFGFGFLF